MTYSLKLSRSDFAPNQCFICSALRRQGANHLRFDWQKQTLSFRMGKRDITIRLGSGAFRVLNSMKWKENTEMDIFPTFRDDASFFKPYEIWLGEMV